MRNSLGATAALLAVLLVGASTVSPAAPERPGAPQAAVPSRPQPADTGSPAPRTAPSQGRDPTTPPAPWRVLESSGAPQPAALPAPPGTVRSVPTVPSVAPQAPPPPLPPLPAPLPAGPGKTAPAPTTPPPAPDPEIEYLGMTAGPGGTYAVLRLDGKLHVLQVGQAIAKVRLLSATPQNATLRVNGKVKKFDTGPKEQPVGRAGP